MGGKDDVLVTKFSKNKNKYVLTNYKGLEFYFENSVNEKGNGKIIFTFEDKVISKEFLNGKLINYEVNVFFRECFDQAYDDICDGVIGCMRRYSSPFPALTSAAYCGFYS